MFGYDLDDSGIIDDILDVEGGFVDHESDRGGVTKFGITLRALSEWRQAPVSSADLLSLTKDEAREILQHEYIITPGLDRLRSRLIRWFMVDFAVHSGPSTAIKTLQEVVGAGVDGVIGPKTLSAVDLYIERFSENALLVALLKSRLAFLARIVARDPDQAVFFRGWVNRVTRFIDEAYTPFA